MFFWILFFSVSHIQAAGSCQRDSHFFVRVLQNASISLGLHAEDSEKNSAGRRHILGLILSVPISNPRGMSGATWWWNPSKHLQVGKYFGDPLYLKWLVVWNIFYFSIYWECHHPNWLIFFRGVGIPPTSKVQFTSFKSYLQFAEIIRRKVHQGLTWAWTDPRDPFGLERCQATWRIAFLQTWNMVMVCFI